MSVYFTEKSLSQIKELHKNPGLLTASLTDLLQQIREDHEYLTNSSHRVPNVNEEIFVFKFHSLRIFFTKTPDKVIILDIVQKNG